MLTVGAALIDDSLVVRGHDVLRKSPEMCRSFRLIIFVLQLSDRVFQALPLLHLLVIVVILRLADYFFEWGPRFDVGVDVFAPQTLEIDHFRFLQAGTFWVCPVDFIDCAVFVSAWVMKLAGL